MDFEFRCTKKKKKKNSYIEADIGIIDRFRKGSEPM